MTEVGSEDIALAKSKQTALTKAVKRVKKAKGTADDDQAPKGQRGIIMLQHIPHGFYEKEIKSYFTQFGKVLRVRVGRSQKTGKSRGYAFVEFEFEEVAKIAAEAMNNYLMFERLIKCEVLSSDVNAKKLFRLKYIREDNYPKLLARKKEKAKRDLELTEEEGQDVLQQRLQKVEEQNKRAKLGIPYEFKVGKTVVGEKAAAKAERKTKKVEEKVERRG
ncbi:MKI67 FHA domain-interacting nucleolar phosphoprotein [Orchesella cincta]|uniref:MKI67 FHA domain-interacting nucleolar phosphoprotein n=1 Tax=Orchesella cincta TaxID=48709 RepID=A0A1D2MR04_ORCCI|nr:MKI67 FHA domain-interacting nucleolar phosphoprotein [Orchesella cincta]